MKESVRPPLSRPGRFLFMLAIAAAAGGAGVERTLFRDIPPADPARQVARKVLDSRFHSMRDGFSASDWTGLGYAAAWDRARRYFPDSTYLVRPGTHFMAHGFDADGRLFMEIHESAYLRLCVENLRTFAPGSVVGEYARMRAASDGLEAAGFREKVGRLEPAFRDETSHRELRGRLGERAYLRLLAGLREEDYHMIAGGLVHEGMHAGMDDALVARIQAEFKAGRRPVQWDELKAFTAEIGYHGAYGRWASDEIERLWREIAGLLGGLERLRGGPALRPGRPRARFERTRARTLAGAALVRLRVREAWQSAGRARDLSRGFLRDYVKGDVPADLDDLLGRLDRDTTGHVAALKTAIGATELRLRSLEEILAGWDAWAAGRRPFPPPVTDSRAITDGAGGSRWPEPPGAAASALMRRAAQELEKERRSS
ncbi:MAG TPA: hypothetical protein ENO03_01680 [Candidatus Aminicenantes bacterium]|nr:hypothetical protein [Candidatus Aminicenantes bacterium]